jgi:hypothetical protein
LIVSHLACENAEKAAAYSGHNYWGKKRHDSSEYRGIVGSWLA